MSRATKAKVLQNSGVPYTHGGGWDAAENYGIPSDTKASGHFLIKRDFIEKKN